MFCPKCGKEQYDNAAFCHVCGAALIPEQKPAVVPQPIAEQSPVRQAPAPMPNPEPPVEVKAEKKRFKKLPILIGAAALLLVLAIGAGLFFLLRKPAKEEGPRTVRQDMEYAAQEAGRGLYANKARAGEANQLIAQIAQFLSDYYSTLAAGQA